MVPMKCSGICISLIITIIILDISSIPVPVESRVLTPSLQSSNVFPMKIEPNKLINSEINISNVVNSAKSLSSIPTVASSPSQLMPFFYVGDINSNSVTSSLEPRSQLMTAPTSIQDKISPKFISPLVPSMLKPLATNSPRFSSSRDQKPFTRPEFVFPEGPVTYEYSIFMPDRAAPSIGYPSYRPPFRPSIRPFRHSPVPMTSYPQGPPFIPFNPMFNQAALQSSLTWQAKPPPPIMFNSFSIFQPNNLKQSTGFTEHPIFVADNDNSYESHSEFPSSFEHQSHHDSPSQIDNEIIFNSKNRQTSSEKTDNFSSKDILLDPEIAKLLATFHSDKEKSMLPGKGMYQPKKAYEDIPMNGKYEEKGSEPLSLSDSFNEPITFEHRQLTHYGGSIKFVPYHDYVRPIRLFPKMTRKWKQSKRITQKRKKIELESNFADFRAA